MEYQLPRLTKMWSHLERQAGGQVKGMGEKQIEVDKRILRTQVIFFLEVIYFFLLNKCTQDCVISYNYWSMTGHSVSNDC
jgi:hypothetical protein